MTRRLLLGRAGTGKTHACLDRLGRALDEGRRALLLVPTYGQAEHLRLRLTAARGGVGRQTVETFSSLAEAITGDRLRALLPPARRDRLAEEVLRRHFGAAAGWPGFRAEFLAAVKEIKENGASRQEALDQARRHFAEGSRGRRLFEAFGEYAGSQPGLDHEDLLAKALAALRDRPLALDLLLVDGFHDFTGLEQAIVEELSRGARDSDLTLPLDPDDGVCPTFQTAARTAECFHGWSRAPLRENRRSLASPLLHLEQRLFRAPAGKVAAGEAIEVIACAGVEDEADRLARRVVAARRPWSDFLLVRRSFDGMHSIYRAAFRRHGVPLRFFRPEPLAQSAAGRAAALLLRSLLGLPREGRLPLLRSAYFLDAPPPEEQDHLEARLREKGPPEDWLEFPATAAAFTAMEEARGALPGVLERFLGLRRALQAQPGGDEDLARAAALFRALRQEAESVRDLPLPEAAARVLARLPLLSASPPDRRHECVYAVEALDARQWEKPVVLAAGLTAESFPRQVRQDLFLRDDERRAFQEARGFSLPLRSLREDEERYLFYVALTRARERLVLTYAAFDEEGTPQPMSPYLEEALAHLDDARPRAVALAEQYVQERDAVGERDLLPIVADGLARLAAGRARGREAALAAALHDRGTVERSLLARPRRLELSRLRPLSFVEADPAARLSASSVNAYLRCPYLFFLRRMLAAAPPREREMDPLLRGEILHQALQAFVEERMPADAGGVFDRVWGERTRALRLGLSEEAQRRWMRSAMLRAAEDLRGLPVDRVEIPFARELGDITITGRIDRLDRHAAGEIVRDYKSGTPPWKETKRGEDLQLDLYLLALDRPAGALFVPLRKGKVCGFLLKGAGDAAEGDIQVLSAEELRARLDRARHTIAGVAAAARAGRVALRPRDPESCSRDRCDGFDLCRVARGRWLAKAAREGGEG